MTRELKPEGAIYKLEKSVGHGQTATVFKAIREDRAGHSKQLVALKILNSRTAVPWLRREFETLARLNSPHCVRVLGWENLDQGCALVLEWINGVTLLELARTLRFSDQLVTEIVAQASEGLRALHQLGLHHGDLSPSNLLIDDQGLVKIIDFATVPSDRTSIVGTPPYLSPEIWTGAKVGAKSDLFALGLIANDLRTSFSSVPSAPHSCQERANFLATETSGLLALDPQKRVLPNIDSTPELRELLASGVREALCARVNSLRTAALPLSTSVPFKNRLRTSWLTAMGLVFWIAALPVLARAPLDHVANASRSASMSIRSQKWMEFRLNGRPIGYAPLDIVNLRPGSHRLSWKSASGAGEKSLVLAPSQKLLVVEGELLGQGQTRKR